MSCSSSLPTSKNGGRRSSVDEDVVFLKFLDVGLDLVHLGLEDLLARLLADGVELAVVALLLVVAHEHFPLLLEGSDELLALILWHQHALTVSLILLLDLHLANKIVLVLNFCFDLCHVLGDFAVCLLLQEVLLTLCWQLGGYNSNVKRG